MSGLRLMLIGVASGALITAGAAAASSTFTVVEGNASDVTAGGIATWFNGMYSPSGNPRGHVMGTGPVGGPWTQAMVFGSGARIVARGPGARRTILGGTGAYLGATGTSVATRARGRFSHRITYSLPPRGTARMQKSVRVRLGAPAITPRGGAGGVGDGRGIDGTIADASGARVGTYRVDSTLLHVYSGGTREWYLGDATYAFAEGTLMVVGPYIRATGTAPGVQVASGRVVTRGAGAYAGMRGQVVVLPPNPDGSSTHAFTLIRR